MQRSEHDAEAEDCALAANNQAIVTVGYAATLLDRPTPVTLSAAEAGALMFALYGLADRVAAIITTWQR